VKLVSRVGVGTVAAGVSKPERSRPPSPASRAAPALSPLTSLTHAGSPWEIGLAETQQTLLLNGLRTRIAVQADGGIRTGRDVAVAALLGADEFGFATAPLIAAGCIMMRKCHLNTCPVGVATQDPVLRARFTGKPEHVINYFFFVAEELRLIMAQMGFRTVTEMIGRVDKLDAAPGRRALEGARRRPFAAALRAAARRCAGAVELRSSGSWPGRRARPRADRRRATGVRRQGASGGRAGDPERTPHGWGHAVGEVARRFGHAGLPEGSINVKFTGTAGQTFGGFLARGVALELTGDAKRLRRQGPLRRPVWCATLAAPSAIRPRTSSSAHGALWGHCRRGLLRGRGGERFAVRNSGAVAVVEGLGDHGCEYMTGGVVAVLGDTGRNFAAGMSAASPMSTTRRAVRAALQHGDGRDRADRAHPADRPRR